LLPAFISKREVVFMILPSSHELARLPGYSGFSIVRENAASFVHMSFVINYVSGFLRHEYRKLDKWFEWVHYSPTDVIDFINYAVESGQCVLVNHHSIYLIGGAK
jgi:hypothetical protein